jgi:hypothetical protein
LNSLWLFSPFFPSSAEKTLQAVRQWSSPSSDNNKNAFERTVGLNAWVGTPLEKSARESKVRYLFENAGYLKHSPLPIFSFQHLQSSSNNNNPTAKRLEICGRSTHVDALRKFNLLKDPQCQAALYSHKRILLVDEFFYYGRTGNQLIEFLSALHMARDMDMMLGITGDNWAVNALKGIWMINQNDTITKLWLHHLETALCIKFFDSKSELDGLNTTLLNRPKDLFEYKTDAPFNEYVSSTMHFIRSLFLFEHVSTRLCSGIDAIFGNETRYVKYTAIHSRNLEGAGPKMMQQFCKQHGCDPAGAIEMTPDYVKSILGPLGMLKHPIVLITDGQDASVVRRLIADPEIRPLLHMIPDEESWVGGDLTLAMMADIFVGVPVSTFSTFISKARLSLGFGHNYLYRTKNDDDGGWKNSFGDGCVFDYGNTLGSWQEHNSTKIWCVHGNGNVL